MKLKALFTIILVFCVAGCSTLGSNRVSNETLYGAIVRSGEEQNKTLGKIVELLSAKNTAEIKTEVRKEETPRINERKITIGTTISDEEILGVKTATDRNTLPPKKNSADTDTETRLGKLEKRVTKLEKSDKEQNRRLATIETKINGLDITAYAHIVFSEFYGNKLNQKVIGKIKLFTPKFNERVANDEEKVTYQIDVTAFDNNGRYSKKKTQAFADELKKHLSTSFSVNTKESPNIDVRLANCAKITVPF